MKTAEGQFAPSLRPWVGGPDRAPPVGARVWDRAFRQHQLPSGNTAGGVKSNEVRFHLSLSDSRGFRGLRVLTCISAPSLGEGKPQRRGLTLPPCSSTTLRGNRHGEKSGATSKTQAQTATTESGHRVCAVTALKSPEARVSANLRAGWARSHSSACADVGLRRICRACANFSMGIAKRCATRCTLPSPLLPSGRGDGGETMGEPRPRKRGWGRWLLPAQ